MDYLAFQQYKKAYQQLLEGDNVENREELMKTINSFLSGYLQVAEKFDPSTQNIDKLSISNIGTNMVKVAIDIVEDISSAITNSRYTDGTSTRRALFSAFTKPERRVYVGIFLIILSFILYFIDSTV